MTPEEGATADDSGPPSPRPPPQATIAAETSPASKICSHLERNGTPIANLLVPQQLDAAVGVTVPTLDSTGSTFADILEDAGNY
jgi:hypothetical protein